MPKTIITIKTWVCPHCGYSQDFEPTQENMNKHFNLDWQFPLNDVKSSECPSCGLKGSRNKQMILETRPEKKTIVTIMGEEEVDLLEIKDGKDELGKDKTRKLNIVEKEAMKQKIREEIVKYRVLE